MRKEKSKEKQKKKSWSKQILETYKNSSKPALVVYVVARLLIIACMVLMLLNKNYENAILCFLSLILISAPAVLNMTTSIKLPSVFDIIIIVFVFAAEILGEIAEFYVHIPIWDTMLHTTTGFLAAAFAFGTIDLLNKNAKRTQMSAIFVVLVSFCFSMTIGVLWEFGEYTADKTLHLDMQKDRIITEVYTVKLHPDGRNKTVEITNIDKTVIYDGEGNELAVVDGGYLDIGLNDTMKDLLVNFIGAVVFSVFGYLYISRRDRYAFVERIVPRIEE